MCLRRDFPSASAHPRCHAIVTIPKPLALDISRRAAQCFARALAESSMKTLILTAGFGEGHNAAARNLCSALLELNGPDSAQVLDLVKLCYGRLGEMAQKGYLKLIDRAAPVWQKIYEALDDTDMVGSTLPAMARMRDFLADTLAREKPDAVVSTWPLYGYLLDDIFGAESGRPFPFVTIVTDSITVNSVWYRATSDFFIVPNAQTGDVMRSGGVPAEKIKPLGFPVPLPFARAAFTKATPSVGAACRVLYMINSGKAEAPGIVRELAGISGVELTVTVGRDGVLQTAVDAAIRESGRAVEVFGWTDRMPELLMRSHLLIGKAGGASVQETIAARTPMIISQVVPGQEEGNARLIVESGCGAIAGSREVIAQTVAAALENDAQLWRNWHDNISRLSRPDAAMDVAKFVSGLVPNP